MKPIYSVVVSLPCRCRLVAVFLPSRCHSSTLRTLPQSGNSSGAQLGATNRVARWHRGARDGKKSNSLQLNCSNNRRNERIVGGRKEGGMRSRGKKEERRAGTTMASREANGKREMAGYDPAERKKNLVGLEVL